MKKVILALGIIFLLGVASVIGVKVVQDARNKQIEKDLEAKAELVRQAKRDQFYKTHADCTINGHDCWDVVWMTYNPSKLKEIGLSIVEGRAYNDGGSSLYVLSNGIRIFRHRKMVVVFSDGRMTDSEGNGRTSVTWPNGKQFVFNIDGIPVSYTPAQQETN